MSALTIRAQSFSNASSDCGDALSAAASTVLQCVVANWAAVRAPDSGGLLSVAIPNARQHQALRLESGRTLRLRAGIAVCLYP